MPEKSSLYDLVPLCSGHDIRAKVICVCDIYCLKLILLMISDFDADVCKGVDYGNEILNGICNNKLVSRVGKILFVHFFWLFRLFNVCVLLIIQV